MAHRLFELKLSAPARIPPLVSYGFTSGLVRIEHRRVQGRPLLSVSRLLSPEARLRLGRELRATIADWRSNGFVHGDLTPRNILVETGPEGPRAWFVDWILDLSSFEGTPQFAASEVWEGRRSAESDCYAIDKILCILLRNHSESL